MKKPWGDQLLVWQEWIQKRNAKDQEVAFIARGYDEAMDPRCGGDHGIFDQMVCLAAHASRGRPSPRRLPRHLRQRVLHLARTRYLGFNDHHLAEKLQAVEGFSAQSPQAKGRIERLWGVLQDRLCSELRLAHASDLDSANGILRQFIADYNRRFARTPRDIAKAWRPAPHDLNRICSFRHERIVSNDNVVQWEGRRFQIAPQARRFTFAGAKVQLYQTLDGRVSLYYGEARLAHTAASGG